MEKVIVVLGPTGVGKTKLSIALATYFNGEIINGDAMQGYIGMDIGTAKVRDDEKAGIAHHLFDILPVTSSNSVKDNQVRVREKIKNIAGRNHLPIMVGGTGLYLKSALYDYQFEEIEGRNATLEDKYQHLNNEELHNYLSSFDESSAAAIHKNNRRRVLRAIEVYENSGIIKSEYEKKQSHTCLYDVLFIGLQIERKLLHTLTDIRVDKMFEEGLLIEVSKLNQIPNFWDSTASRAIGYKEFIPYFNGEITLDDVKNIIKIHTHQYIKRQYTWFNNQLNVNWLTADTSCFEKTIEEAVELVTKFINN